MLMESIRKLKMNKTLKEKGSNFYNYILFDGDCLYKIINNFDINSLKLRKISNFDLHELKKSIIYVGKGKNNRKRTHLVERNFLWVNFQLQR